MAKKDFETLWEDVRVWLGDATRSALKEAEDLTRRGRLKVELFRLTRETEQALTRLGGLVYERLSRAPGEPIALDDELNRLYREVARLESELKAKKKEYEAERKRR